MSQISHCHLFNPNWIPTQSAAANTLIKPAESLIEQYGTSVVGNAAAQLFVGLFAVQMKQDIVNSDMPGIIKDFAVALIDKCVAEMNSRFPVAQEAANDLQNSEVENTVLEQLAQMIAEYQNGGNTTDTEAPGAQTQESGTESTESAPASNPSDEAAAEAAAEALDEGPGAAADAALSDQLSGLQEDEETKKKKGGAGGGGNFLEALAGNMARTQAKFLNEAYQHSKTMESLAGNTGADSSAFTNAQAKYTAMMQMFNIYSNQVATSLKTLGESMSTIARKQ